MGNAPTKGLHHKNRGHKKYVHWDQAVPPWPPGKPHLVPGSPNSQPNAVTIRWDPPPDDGGAPITGYLVEQRKTGTPNWERATTDLVLEPELRLSGLEPGWRYQFRVTAENAADLLSDPGELSQPLTVARAYRPATMAPQFSLELRDTVALENDKAEFLVHFHGIPTPKISWYKDSFEIFSSRRMRVTINSDSSSLVIYQAAFSDEGEFKCTATNRAGHIFTKAKLRLEAPPRIRIPRQYEDGLLFEKDEIIRLKVSVLGRPLPRVTWYHNNDFIPFGGRYEVSNTERTSGLRISEARRSDRGEYQVRATSRLGEDIVAFLVTVTDRPMPPGRATVVMSLGKSVTLSWKEPDDDGGCKIGNYIVEYYRLGWNVWLKAATCRQLTTTLSDLIEGSEYKFRVKAENPYGVSDPSLESDVVFIPDPKRGLLERPTRGSGSQTSVKLEELEKRREQKLSKDSLVGKDTNETKKRKDAEMKTTMQDRITPDRKKQRSEELRKLEERLNAISQNRADFTKRKNKENVEKRSVESSFEDVPEIVKRQRKNKSGKSEVSPETKPRLPKIQVETEKGVKASLQFSVSKRRESSGDRDSGVVSEESYTTGSKQSFTSPLLPREDDDSLLHGSSELMLVLLPQTEGTQGERTDTNRASEFEMFGESSVPPPMSLSAPELGSGEPIVTAPLRNAVSSTELLHEQAMARFYQAVAAEEAEKARQRKESMNHKSTEPSSDTKKKPLVTSMEAEDMDMKGIGKKRQVKMLETAPKQELTWHQRKQRKTQDRLDSSDVVPSIRRASPQPEINIQSFLNRKEPTRLYTEEEEETVVERIHHTPLSVPKPQSILRSREEERYTISADEEAEEEEQGIIENICQKPKVLPVETKTRSILRRSEEEEFSILRRREEEEERQRKEMETEEKVEVEEEEEDYFDNEELEEEEEELEEEEEEEESLEEDGSEFDDEEELYKSIEEEEQTYQPRYIDKFAEDEEEDTYHPRDMVPKDISRPETPVARTIVRQLTPRPSNDVPLFPRPILKYSSKFQEELDNMVERGREPLARNLERSPPKSFRETPPKILLPSFSSDRSSHSPSPLPETDSWQDVPKNLSLREEQVDREVTTDLQEEEDDVFMLASETNVSEAERAFFTPEPVSPEPDSNISAAESFASVSDLPEIAPIASTYFPEPSKPASKTIETEPAPPKPAISVPEPAMSAAEAARLKRMLIRKASIEEDNEGCRAMADLYGDIIREHSRPRKPVKRYLNTEEMKAAAEKSRTHERNIPTPESPPLSPTPEPERELVTPEPTVPEQPITTEQDSYDRYTAPIQRPPTPRRKSKTPDLVLIRQPSRDRSHSRVPSTERFAAELSKQFPEVARRFSPERSSKGPEISQSTRELETAHPVTPKLMPEVEMAERKWRSIFSYLADLAMFLVACWLYAFKDERLAIPILILMIYRQVHAAIKRKLSQLPKLPKLPSLPWKRSS